MYASTQEARQITDFKSLALGLAVFISHTYKSRFNQVAVYNDVQVGAMPAARDQDCRKNPCARCRSMSSPRTWHPSAV